MATIYERIGGAPAIEAAVDIFYNKVINDKRINYWFSHMDMQAQRKKQDTFLTMAFGGPSEYTGRDMANAHLKLVEKGLNDTHFDAVAENLVSTLIELSVPQSLIDEIAEVLESQRDIVLCRQNALEVTHAQEPSESDLIKEGYKQYTLEDRVPEPGCEHKYIRLKFKPPGDMVPLESGQHLQLITKVNGKWVQRSYTPVSEPHSPEVELLIKVYHEGPMSTFLSNLPVHSKVWMKGPLGHFIYHPGMAQQINMFACGSGITPMWQVINSIYKNIDDTTRVLLVHGCRHDNELALFDQFSQISAKRPQIRISHTLSVPSNKWIGSKGRISNENYESFKPFSPAPHTINLLCGTDEFVASLKKMLKDAGHSETSIVIF